MHRQPRCRFALACGIVELFLTGCTAPALSPAEWELRDGRTLGQLVADADPAVVLLMDPAQCFSCTNLLAVWLDWRHQNPKSFALVLSRNPEPWELQRLAPLPVSGVLERPLLDIGALPMELVFSGGGEVYRSASLRGVSVSPLLNELRETPLVQAISALSPRADQDTL